MTDKNTLTAQMERVKNEKLDQIVTKEIESRKRLLELMDTLNEKHGKQYFQFSELSRVLLRMRT